MRLPEACFLNISEALEASDLKMALNASNRAQFLSTFNLETSWKHPSNGLEVTKKRPEKVLKDPPLAAKKSL